MARQIDGVNPTLHNPNAAAQCAEAGRARVAGAGYLLSLPLAYALFNPGAIAIPPMAAPMPIAMVNDYHFWEFAVGRDPRSRCRDP